MKKNNMDSLFYKQVQKVYPELQDILLANSGMLLALPQDCSMRNVNVTKSLIRAHILKCIVVDHVETPTTAENFTTTEWYHTLCGKCVQLISRRDPITGSLTRHLSVGKQVSDYSTFLETRQVEIIDDEMCYGVETESFTALILERPLMGRGDVPRLKDGVTPLYDADRSSRDWKKIIEDLARHDSIVSNVLQRCLKLATKIPQVFADVITAFDVADAADDLHEASESLAQVLATSKIFIHAAHVPRLFSMVTEALESIICSASYADTFGVYCNRLSKSERVLMAELFRQRERGWRPKELQGDLSHIKLIKSKSHMYLLNDARSPLAKLHCIHNVVHSIMEDVSDHSVSMSIDDDKTASSTTVIAADELLPLLITAICEAALPCLLANTLYMREMSSYHLREGKLGYSLAMFEAAVAFIGRRVWSSVTEDLGDRDFGVSVTGVNQKSSFETPTEDGTMKEDGETKVPIQENENHGMTAEESARKKFGDGLISQEELDTILQSSLLYRNLCVAADLVEEREEEEDDVSSDTGEKEQKEQKEDKKDKKDQEEEEHKTEEEHKAEEEALAKTTTNVAENDEVIDPLGGLETRKRAMTVSND